MRDVRPASSHDRRCHDACTPCAGRPSIDIEAAAFLALRPDSLDVVAGRLEADEVVLNRGSIYLVRGPRDGGRPVFAVTLAVGRLDSAMAGLDATAVGLSSGEDARGRRARIEPVRANGAWLEFLEVRR